MSTGGDMRVLVAGGTGRLGTALVRDLTAREFAVRVLARDPSRAADLLPKSVELLAADVRNPTSLLSAFDGVDVAVSAVQGFAGRGRVSPASVDRDGNRNLIDAASRAGADVILMSVIGASASSPLELFRMKYAAERYLIDTCRSWTIVRASAFLEMWVEILRQTAGSSGRLLVFGRGDNPINFVSVVDVAALLSRAVTDGTTRGEILEIGGPRNLTFNDLAAAVQSADGGRNGVRHVPRPALRTLATTAPLIHPAFGRQVRSALVMDTTSFAFDDSALRQRFPDLPRTSLDEVLSPATS